MTYPDDRVAAELAAGFIATRFNTYEPDAQTRQLARELRLIWTPFVPACSARAG